MVSIPHSTNKDPLLNEHKGVSSEGFEFSFISLPTRVVVVVAAYVQLIWTIKNFKKTTTTKEIIQNAQKMFKDNQEEAVDVLWKEHCAGSLRELVNGHITADFPYVLKCLPEPANKNGQVEEKYPTLQKYKDFLNEMAHLNGNRAIEKANGIPNRKNVSGIDAKLFDKICTDFIFLLHNLFRENCMKGE